MNGGVGEACLTVTRRDGSLEAENSDASLSAENLTGKNWARIADSDGPMQMRDRALNAHGPRHPRSLLGRNSLSNRLKSVRRLIVFVSRRIVRWDAGVWMSHGRSVRIGGTLSSLMLRLFEIRSIACISRP
jgi:hypothetical protein